MKKNLFIIFLGITTLSLFSQAPEAFSYQAVVRTPTGDPVTDQVVAFQFSIIKGSPVGPVVYKERHVVITDPFGFVALAIGNGSVIIGNFETIDWGVDSYYIKVELDTTGGTFYTDMGTTQLLSVPYALYAKTSSGSGFSGDYNDLTNKPLLDGSETKISAGNNIALTGSGTISAPYIITNGFSGSYSDLTNKPVTDGSETKISAGNNITITGTGTLSSPYNIINGFSGDYNTLSNKPVIDGSETKISAGKNIKVTGTGTLSDPYTIINGFGGDTISGIPSADGSETKINVGENLTISGLGTTTEPYLLDARSHYVGESYGGGIVFYVYDKGMHGLIAATVDQDPAGMQWYNGVKRYTNTTGDGLGAGNMNTALIIALQTNDNQTGTFAAKVCADYSVTVDGVSYGDWYLPSKFELALMFISKDIIGNFKNDYYWSSSEFSSISAWSQNFSVGYQYNLNKSLPYGVRAVRAF